MPRIGPIERKDPIHYLRHLNFIGPYSGGKYDFMLKGHLRVRISNPHKGDIGKNLLTQVLREAGIDRTTWEKL